MWHKCLYHASKGRLTRLVTNEIFQNFKFTDFILYLDCIKGKQIKHKKKKKTTKSNYSLKLYTPIYVKLMMFNHLVEKSILSLLLMIVML